jgi:hypothetical protein
LETLPASNALAHAARPAVRMAKKARVLDIIARH